MGKLVKILVEETDWTELRRLAVLHGISINEVIRRLFRESERLRELHGELYGDAKKPCPVCGSGSWNCGH